MIGVYIGHKNKRRITKTDKQMKDNKQTVDKSKSILKQIDEHKDQSCKLQIIVADV